MATPIPSQAPSAEVLREAEAAIPSKVLAKGRKLLAEEIKAESRWSGVPILENPPLARSLYRSVEVGQAIPVDSTSTG